MDQFKPTDREAKIICIMGCLNFPGFKESPQETKELMVRSAFLTAGLKYDSKEMSVLVTIIQQTVANQYSNGLKALNQYGSSIKQMDSLD